jgi:NAD(P)-dependent dehydrogenase (short-subunit alcohol dehydrogenase family)
VRLVETVVARHGRIDLFCSNAGIIERSGLDAPLDAWRRTMDVNFMAHVYAARAVIPHMLAQGAGYLLQTASAAGLLMQVDSATYTVSKHAAVAFAEWLSVNYQTRGIGVSCLCPQGVRTPMLLGPSGDRTSFLLEGSVSAAHVAECCVRAIEAETFLVLPHPEVADYERRKTTDRDRWLGGMRRMKAKIDADPSLQGRD